MFKENQSCLLNILNKPMKSLQPSSHHPNDKKSPKFMDLRTLSSFLNSKKANQKEY